MAFFLGKMAAGVVMEITEVRILEPSRSFRHV